MPLSAEQLQDFHRDGFVIVRQVFTQADLDVLRVALTEAMDRAALALQAEGKLEHLYRELAFEQRFGRLLADCPAIGRGFDFNQLLLPELFAHLHHPGLLDCLQSLLGPAINCSPIMHIRAKPPVEVYGGERSHFEVPWHQDSAVMLEETDQHMVLTCWTPVGDATEEMGCMRLIPGVQQQGHLPHVSQPGYGTTIRPDCLPTTEPVPAVCAAGDVVIMSQFVPHHSTPNLSDRCRWSLDLRYQASTTPCGRPWYPAVPVRRADGGADRDHAAWCAAWRRALSEPNRGVVHRVEPVPAG